MPANDVDPSLPPVPPASCVVLTPYNLDDEDEVEKEAEKEMEEVVEKVVNNNSNNKEARVEEVEDEVEEEARVKEVDDDEDEGEDEEGVRTKPIIHNRLVGEVTLRDLKRYLDTYNRHDKFEVNTSVDLCG